MVEDNQLTREELLGTVRTLTQLVEAQRAQIDWCVRQNKRIMDVFEKLVELPTGFDAIRFLAELHEIEPPTFGEMVGAAIVIRSSDDIEAVRVAAKALLRNLQRLEDKLDEANHALYESNKVRKEQ